MLQWPCWTSCQSVSEGRRSAVEEDVADVGVAVDHGPARARLTRPQRADRVDELLRVAHLERDARHRSVRRSCPGSRAGRASASCSRCAARARTCRRGAELSQSNACRRASSPRVDATWSTEYGRERVEELAAGGDDVLGDHDAVPGLGMHVGPHAAHRAHAGGVGEVAVERGLRLTGLAHGTALLGEVALDAQVRRQPRRQGVALDVEPDVGRHPLDDGPPRHRGDLDAGESQRQRTGEPLGRQQHVERVGDLDGRRLLRAHVVVSCMVNVGGAAVVPPSAPRQNAQS